MHRSGTSLLTHLLELMGCFVGSPDELLEPNRDNPRGFHERRDAVELNDRLLRSLGHDWRHVAGLDVDSITGEQRNAFDDAGSKIVARLDRHRPWVLKDPRMCWLFSLWRELLERPLGVFIHRSPVEVAWSLYRRDGLMVPYSIALWEAYNLSILRHAQGLGVATVAYRDLMLRPVDTVTRLHRDLAALGADTLELPSEEQLLSAIDPVLYRQRIDTEQENGYLTTPQARLYETLISGQAFDSSHVPQLSPASRELIAGVEELDARAARQEQEMRQRNDALLDAEQIRNDMQASATALQGRLDDTQTDLAAHREALARARGDFEATRDTLGEERRHFAEQLALREQALAAKDRSLDEYRRSAAAVNERLAVLAEDLENHRRDLGRSRSDFRATEQALLDEREQRAEDIDLRERALRAKDQTIEELNESIEDLRRLLRTREAELEMHREMLQAKEQTLEDFAESAAALRRVLRERDEALAVQRQALEAKGRTLDDFVRSVAEFEKRLAATEADLQAHREALERAGEAGRKLQPAVDRERGPRAGGPGRGGGESASRQRQPADERSA